MHKVVGILLCKLLMVNQLSPVSVNGTSFHHRKKLDAKKISATILEEYSLGNFFRVQFTFTILYTYLVYGKIYRMVANFLSHVSFTPAT